MEKTSKNIIDQELIDEFISEFRENIQDAINDILLFEKDAGDEESLHAIFRNFHTIKGNAAVVGFERISRLSHEAESLLDNIRDKTLTLNPQIIETLLRTADVLTTLVDEVTGEATLDDGKWNDIIDSISRHMASKSPSPAPPAT